MSIPVHGFAFNMSQSVAGCVVIDLAQSLDRQALFRNALAHDRTDAGRTRAGALWVCPASPTCFI